MSPVYPLRNLFLPSVFGLSTVSHKTMIGYGGLEFDCYFALNKLEQHGTFIKWYKYPSKKLWYSKNIPHRPPLGTRAFQNSKICPPNSVVDLCVHVNLGNFTFFITYATQVIARYVFIFGRFTFHFVLLGYVTTSKGSQVLNMKFHQPQ